MSLGLEEFPDRLPAERVASPINAELVSVRGSLSVRPPPCCCHGLDGYGIGRNVLQVQLIPEIINHLIRRRDGPP